MNKQEALDFYKEYNNKCNAYNLALTTMYFDNSTIAPINGSEYRIQMMSFLSGELFDYQTSKENIDKLNEMNQMDLGEVMNKEIKLVLKNLNKIALLPKAFYINMQQVYSLGEIAWRKAKQENNYSLFKDQLKEIVDITKQAYTYYNTHDNLYDAMLDDYETGMNMQKYDEFFNVIKERLVPFVKKVINSPYQIDDSILHLHYDSTSQAKVMDTLKEYMGFK